MNASFQERLGKIEKYKSPRRAGVVYYTADKQIVIQSRRAWWPSFPWKQMTGALLFLVLIKACALQVYGEGEYGKRIMTIGQSSLVEKAGIYLLHIDPVTRAIAGTLDSFNFPTVR
jgi:hypothetical protein